MAELVRRPELDYFMLTEIDEKRPELSYDTAEQVNINIKYEGYLKRQQQQVAQFKKLEKKKLGSGFCSSHMGKQFAACRQYRS